MTFFDWLLEENRKIVFSSWANDGTVVVYINGDRYQYNVDPVYHYELKKMAKYKPFSALNQIKKIPDSFIKKN